MAPKVVVLVLSHDQYPWSAVEVSGQRKTWLNNVPDGVQVFFYYGKSNMEHTGDRLFFDFPEGYSNIGHKTLAAFEYVHNNLEYDFIFRTNTSSYVHLPRLVKHLSKFDPSMDLYHGVKCVPPEFEIKRGLRPIFASGCGYTLSKATVSKVLEHRGSWDHNQIDDLALAWLMKDLGVPVTDAPRIDFNHPSKFDPSMLTDPNVFHVRCKCEVGGDRLLDIEIMSKVHDAIGGCRE